MLRINPKPVSKWNVMQPTYHWTKSSSFFVDETKLLQGWIHSNSLHPPSCLCLLLHQEQIDIWLLMLKPKWESKKWNDCCTNSQCWCWNGVKSSWCCRVESIKFPSQQFPELVQVSSCKTFSRASQLYHRFKWKIHFWSCFGVSKVEIVMFSGNDYSKSVDYWSLGLLCHEIGDTSICHNVAWTFILGLFSVSFCFNH